MSLANGYRGALLCTLILLCAAPEAAIAQAPDRVDYQGVLRDASGQPMNGPVSIVLRIWSSASSLAPVDLLYQETHTAVALLDGVFQLEIGQGLTTAGSFDAQLFASPERWLEVEVGGERLAPRQKLSSVAYALRAELAGSADLLGPLSANDVQRRVVGTCPAGQSIRAIGGDGSVTCEPDDDTLYTAGSGIALQGTEFSLGLDPTALQQRVSGTCPAGQSIRVINQDGTVVCEIDSDVNTTYSAGAGLTLTGTTFSIPNGGVTSSMLAANAVTNPILATSSVDSRVVVDNSLAASDLAPDSVGASEIAAGAVGSSELATGAVTGADVQDGSLTGADIALGSLPSSLLSNAPGADFTNLSLAPIVSPVGATVLSLDLDLPSAGLVIAMASGHSTPLGGTITTSCEIRLDSADTDEEMRFTAFTGANNPFGGIRVLSPGAGPATITLFCQSSSAVNAAISAPQLTTIFVP